MHNQNLNPSLGNYRKLHAVFSLIIEKQIQEPQEIVKLYHNITGVSDMPNNQVHTNTEAPQLHQSDWFADHLLLLFWCINMLEIQRIALKQFLTISLTVHGKFLDSCFLFKSSIQGERHHECIAWMVEKWYPKTGSYLYGDTVAIHWVLLFCEQIHRPIHLGGNTVRVLMLVASYWRTYQHVVHTSLTFICLFQDAWSPL